MLPDICPDKRMIPLISVVVPVYNVIPYLAACLDSLLNQTYRPIEIIAVNDASTDDSLSVLHHYEQLDSRISVIDNPVNRGIGYSRNVGMDKAQGNLVFFIDSDDCLEPDTICRVAAQMGDRSDICIFNGHAFREDVNQRSAKPYFSLEPGYLDKGCSTDEIRQKLARQCHSACMKAYRLPFLRMHSLRFPEGIYGEDVQFWLQCLTLTSDISYCDYPGYLRRVRDGSVMTGNPKKNITDRIGNLEAILDICRNDILLYNYVAGEYIPYLRYRVLQIGNADLTQVFNNTLNRLIEKFE